MLTLIEGLLPRRFLEIELILCQTKLRLPILLARIKLPLLLSQRLVLKRQVSLL